MTNKIKFFFLCFFIKDNKKNRLESHMIQSRTSKNLTKKKKREKNDTIIRYNFLVYFKTSLIQSAV